MSTTPETPAYKPGDIVNGHQLVLREDGHMEWVLLPAAEVATPGSVGAPVGAPASPKKSRRNLWVVLGSVGAVLLLIIIIGSANRPKVDDPEPAANTAASEAAEPSAEPEEPEKVIVPDVTGMDAAAAVAILRGAGFEVADPADASMIVTGTTPAKGGIAEVSTTVTLTVEPPAPTLTLAQENALEQAQSYLDYSSFSRQGLIDQMSSEYGSGYPVDVATWAVDYLNVDWNAQAAEQAKSYLEYSSFSRDALFDQLTSEYGSQFTPEQANAGLAAVGY